MRRGARLLGFLCLWLPQLRCEGPVQPEQVHLSYPGELWEGTGLPSGVLKCKSWVVGGLPARLGTAGFNVQWALTFNLT